MKSNRLREKVPEEEYRTALANTDNRRIIKSVTNVYFAVLTVDEREECGLLGLWRALQSHNFAQTENKFTNSLYKFTKWACQHELRAKHRRKPHISLPGDVDKPVPEADPALAVVRDNLEELESVTATMLRQHHFEYKTTQEIAALHDISVQAVRARIRKGIQQLRQRCRE